MSGVRIGFRLGRRWIYWPWPGKHFGVYVWKYQR